MSEIPIVNSPASNIDENQTMINGYTPITNDSCGTDEQYILHFAAEAASTEIFEQILQENLHLIDRQDKNGFTPLLIAAMSGKIDIITLLLENGAQIDHIDNEKHTAVHWAVVCGQLDALKLLLRKGAAANAGDAQSAKPLHYATVMDDIPFERGETILYTLLKNGASVNQLDIDNRTPIHWAASNGNLAAVQSFIKAGGNCGAADRDQLTPMHCAASHGHKAVLEVLIDSSKESFVDCVDRNGDTPLFYAAALGHYDCARLLLLNDANPNHQDHHLRSPSHCAAARGQLNILKLLKHYGASFEAQNNRGDIPLHESIQAPSKETVEWLLSLHPSTLNAANHGGRTGLHLAAVSGNMELVVLLCSKGAEVDPLMTYRDTLCTPLDLAKRKNHEVVVQYLQQRHGARFAKHIPDEKCVNAATLLDGYAEQEVMRSQAAELITHETQTESPKRRPIGTNTSRPSSAFGFKQPLPKATSTTDLNNYERRQYQIIDYDDEPLKGIVSEGLIKMIKKGAAKLETVENRKQQTHLLEARNIGDCCHHSICKSDHDLSGMVTPQITGLCCRRCYCSYSNPHINGYESARNPISTISDRNGLDEGDTGKNSNDARLYRRYANENAIFQELTHLKRIQIQYGKSREPVLVRSLINSFCKVHGLNPAYFKFQTFQEWEKFLYDKLSDQLKMVYLQERDRLMNASRFGTINSNRRRFDVRRAGAVAGPIQSIANSNGDYRLESGFASPEIDSQKMPPFSERGSSYKRCACLSKYT